MPAVGRVAAAGEAATASIAVPPTSFSAIADGLEAALRARAPAQHAGTRLVRKLAAQVSRLIGLDATERLAVDVCAQVRDVGMIALPDSVVVKSGPLSPDEWALLNRHPELGAELLRTFPTMSEAAELVRAHHERWDGDGYPDGLQAEAIPLPSRIVAVCDAFVAIATDRPHRRGIGAEGAIEYLVDQRGMRFDPRPVDCLLTVLTSKAASGRRKPLTNAQPAVTEPPSCAPGTLARPRELRSAIAEFEAVPAFEPAVQRVLAAVAFTAPLGDVDLASAIESDMGLTVAILRAAQMRSQVPVATVPTALAVLAREDIRRTVAALPTVAFPWQTKFEALLVRCATHTQAVARAADRIAQIVRPFERDELVTAAVLHDLGKLLLALVWPDFATAPTPRGTPEEALHHERREFGYDHASLGGLLAERWRLPSSLVRAISRHHSAYAPSEDAALVRLADMVVHHVHGDAVNREVMLRLATRCDVSADALRTIVVDLPHSGGSTRRRPEPSPLSSRETAVLRLLAEGSRASAIAEELHLSVSTVRTHLHNIHGKLDVLDRTQAVLRATEMGWI